MSTLLLPEQEQKPWLTRRRFLGLAAAGMALYAGEIGRHELQIINLNVGIPNLPDDFVGFRIVQVSDFHYFEYTEASFLESIVRRINDLKPDLVALTGDFVSSKPLPRHFSVGYAYHCAAILSQIACPLRFAVLGNHDGLVGVAAVTDALRTHGLPLLANRSVAIERGGKRIWLAGIKDCLMEFPDLNEALPRTRDHAREPLILLSHEPDYADLALGRKIDLVLSGHTHGGQILIPFAPPLLLPEMGRKYVHGHFRLADGMQLYVNRGIGAVTLPFRFRCPPEISVITLENVSSRALRQDRLGNDA